MSHVATVRTRGGNYQSSTSKDQTRPQDDKESHKHKTQTALKQHQELTITSTRPRIPSSILGPVGYGPTTLPLRHSDRRDQLTTRHGQARRTGTMLSVPRSLLGEQDPCSAYRSQQTTPMTDFWPLLGEQKGVFGEQHMILSKRVLILRLSERELGSDENSIHQFLVVIHATTIEHTSLQ